MTHHELSSLIVELLGPLADAAAQVADQLEAGTPNEQARLLIKRVEQLRAVGTLAWAPHTATDWRELVGA